MTRNEIIAKDFDRIALVGDKKWDHKVTIATAHHLPLEEFFIKVSRVLKHGGLKNNSIVLLNQIRTIDKFRIIDYRGTLHANTMLLIDEALEISLGLRTF